MILSIAGGISKIMGGIYRIPLARMIGDEGIALYQMAYPIYTAILSLATAGIPVAISILVAQKETQGYTGDSRRIFRVSFLILLIFGLILSLGVMKAAPFIAVSILNEPRVYYSILAIAPAILFSSLMSVFRGFFQGYQTMIPTGVSQIIEQLFRVVAILLFALLLVPKGLEYAAAGAAFGAAIGGMAGLILLVVYYFLKGKQVTTSYVYSGTSTVKLAKEVVRLAVPVSLGACVLPLVQLLDAVIVRKRLEFIGYSHLQATALFGQLSGKAGVLIGLATIFSIAVATSIVPAVSEAFAKQDHNLLTNRINYGFRAGAIISFPCTAGLYILAFPICDLLYKTVEAGIPLRALAFSCITLAAFQLSSACLQGIGRPEIAMKSLLFTGLLKVIFNYYLTSIPSLNIKGAAIGTVFAFLIGSSFNIIALWRITGLTYEAGRILKIGLVSVLMAIIVKFLFHFFLRINIHSYAATVSAIIIGIVIYGAQLFILKELDLKMIRDII